jgi:hypothetical protein
MRSLPCERVHLCLYELQMSTEIKHSGAPRARRRTAEIKRKQKFRDAVLERRWSGDVEQLSITASIVCVMEQHPRAAHPVKEEDVLNNHVEKAGLE